MDALVITSSTTYFESPIIFTPKSGHKILTCKVVESSFYQNYFMVIVPVIASVQFPWETPLLFFCLLVQVV